MLFLYYYFIVMQYMNNTDIELETQVATPTREAFYALPQIPVSPCGGSDLSFSSSTPATFSTTALMLKTELERVPQDHSLYVIHLNTNLS